MSELFSTLQKILPQHGLSRMGGRVANSTTPWLKDLLIKQFARVYDVNLKEAERGAFEDYNSFNDFFTRALRADARPLAQGEQTLVSPADGTVSQLGDIHNDQLLQAKGHTYSVHSLAGELGDEFNNGSFCTIYLAPSDYHRVHLPFNGTLTHTKAIPGALYSVNAATEANIEGLFARNERLVCRFETDYGPMLVILVGAMIVASIETDWLGPASPYMLVEDTEHHLVYRRGDEIGQFLLGSTVICCFTEGSVALAEHLQAGTKVKMGEAIGTFL
ncbi:MAG: archaetidylserine decarboxylase [Pseudomonadaceae bacterium]|nr:archaetidylserine decarboxylase [Pseudomonadaceae bacterium]